jgi:hypothetical protein
MTSARPFRRAVLVLALACAATPAPASEREDLEQLRNTTLGLIQALVEQGLLSRDKAAELIKRAQTKAPERPAEPQSARIGPDGRPVVRVPYVSETVKTQIREEVKQEVLAQAKRERWGDPGALPDWLERIRFEGDLRLRLQQELFDRNNTPAAFFQAQGAPGNPAYAPDLTNTTEDRTRLTLRARFGLLAQVGQNVQAGFRISTGSLTSPASTSQTLGGGNNNFNRYTVGLDRAYLRWRPETWLQFDGGRMPNPFFATDLVWAEDLAFDGVAATVRRRLTDRFLGIATIGAFPLQELEGSKRDRWLTGVQVGGEWTLNEETRVKFGVAQYHFRSIEGVPEAAGSLGTALYGISEYRRNLRQKGNTLFNIADPLAAAPNNVLWGLASRFAPLNLTASAEFAQFDPVYITVSADYVKNLGFDRSEIRARTGIDLEARTAGYQYRAQVGDRALRNARDWQVFGAVRRLERDAVPDGFTDTTWNLGGTNYKGWSLGASYGLDRNAWATLRWTSTRALTYPGGPWAPFAVDIVQLDFNARF